MFMFVTEYQSHSRYGAIRREVSEENSFPSHNILKTTSLQLVFLHDQRQWIGFTSRYHVLRKQLQTLSLIKKTRPAKDQRKKPLYNAQGGGGGRQNKQTNGFCCSMTCYLPVTGPGPQSDSNSSELRKLHHLLENHRLPNKHQELVCQFLSSGLSSVGLL